MNLRPGLDLCLSLLSRTRARGWQGTGLGFYRSRPLALGGGACLLSFSVDLYGGSFSCGVGLTPRTGAEGSRRVAELDAALRAWGYKAYRRGPHGQRAYRKGLVNGASIDQEWARLRVRGRASRKEPFRKMRSLSTKESHLVFQGLLRWFRRARPSEWKVAGAELSLPRREIARGCRWDTRRDVMLDRQGIHAAFFAWPRPPFRVSDRKRLEGAGFYRRADEALAEIGLTGRWGPMSAARPNELSADHWKRGITSRELPRIWDALSKFRLPESPDP